MVTLTDVSADGRLEARYLNDRRGVLMRATFVEQVLYGWDFEPFGTPSTYGGSTLPQIRSTNSVAAASGTSATVPLPTTWVAGDLCYIVYSMNGVPASITLPSGWTTAAAPVNPTANVALGVIKRILQAGDTSVLINFAANARFTAISMAIFNHDVITPEDVAAVGDVNPGGNAPNVRAPSISPVTDGCLLITCHGVRNNTHNQVTSFTPPPGMTEVREVSVVNATQSGAALEIASLSLGNAGATGTKTATVPGTITNITPAGISLVVRPAVPPGLNINGAFAWKNHSMIGPHTLSYDAPGNLGVGLQWCSAILKSNGTPCTVSDIVSPVTSKTGSVTTATFNVPANTLVAAMIGYNASPGDAYGEKITFSNNKGLTTTKIVERAHGDGDTNGGAAIALTWSASAQTGMTITATTSADPANDDLAMKVILIGNIDSLDMIPDGVVEETSYGNVHYLTTRVQTVEQGMILWAANDWFHQGITSVSELNWVGVGGAANTKTAVTPISGQQSLLNTWTTSKLYTKLSLNSPFVIKGPKGVRLSFKILGTEGLSATWPQSSRPHLEIRALDYQSKIFATNLIGFPGNVLRSWSTDFFVPKGVSLRGFEIIGNGWDSSAAARFDDIQISEIRPQYARFVRKTDGGYVRGGHPAQVVQGVAYAFDDELTPGQLTEWYAEPIYPGDQVGAKTGDVGFTIEDRDPDLPSTLVKSLEDANLWLFLSTDQRDITASRSTTFVSKQTTGKPAGGVNSAYSLAGNYVLITRTIAEMKSLMEILESTVVYISPTGRYNRTPFYATPMEYTIVDFARMDSIEKTFMIKFQEVERPETEGQPSFLPLHDYAWLSEEYDTYGQAELTAQTYDQLSFYSVL